MRVSHGRGRAQLSTTLPRSGSSRRTSVSAPELLSHGGKMGRRVVSDVSRGVFCHRGIDVFLITAAAGDEETAEGRLAT